MWVSVNGKGPRFVAKAVRHYISVLETARDHVTVEEAYFFDNDISMYKAILRVLDQEKWPENRA
jgi:hypothetical protein